MRPAHPSRILRIVVALVALVGLVGCASLSSRAAAMPAASPSKTALPVPSQTATRAPSKTALPTPSPSQTVLPVPSSTSPSPDSRTSTGAPEPTGHAGRYVTVGLGDSVPSAANCPGCVSFVDQVGERIAEETGEREQVDNLAVAGYTSSDVLSQFDSASVRSQIADSDLVVITVGANDLADGLTGSCDLESGCVDTRIAQIRSRLTEIIEEVRTLQTAPDATVVVTGYWNVGQDGDVGQQNGEDYVTTSRTLTRMFNAMAAGVAGSQKAVYADFYTPFVGADGSKDPTDLLVSDGDHPNAAGHAKLAAAVISALGL